VRTQEQVAGRSLNPCFNTHALRTPAASEHAEGHIQNPCTLEAIPLYAGRTLRTPAATEHAAGLQVERPSGGAIPCYSAPVQGILKKQHQHDSSTIDSDTFRTTASRFSVLKETPTALLQHADSSLLRRTASAAAGRIADVPQSLEHLVADLRSWRPPEVVRNLPQHYVLLGSRRTSDWVDKKKAVRENMSTNSHEHASLLHFRNHLRRRNDILAWALPIWQSGSQVAAWQRCVWIQMLATCLRRQCLQRWFKSWHH